MREALLAALDDCTEEVRYQAAIAFCEAAGNPCQNCDRNGCCNAAVMTKLEEMAHGQDEKGCFKEASSRVRAAAENALERLPPKNHADRADVAPTRSRAAEGSAHRRAGRRSEDDRCAAAGFPAGRTAIGRRGQPERVFGHGADRSGFDCDGVSLAGELARRVGNVRPSTANKFAG